MACAYTGQAGLFFTVFFVGGYILASRVFQELGDYRTGYMYLTLPVSNLERLLVGWATTSVMYSMLGMAAFLILSHLANFLAASSFGFQFQWIGFGTIPWVKLFGIFIVTQSVFILGSAFFKKHAFLKTLLAIFILQNVIGIISFLLGWGIITEFSTGSLSIQENSISEGLVLIMETTVPIVAKILFWGILGPFFLTASYFKIKETEI